MKSFASILLLVLFVATSVHGFSAATRPAQRSFHLKSTEDAEPEPEIEVPPPVAVKCADCDLCDGSGRILGGIGVIFPWWPIKAYRPCPNFIEKGGLYQRSGQALDEIAFGRDTKYTQDQ
uniref:Uncharacterized protein n=1 Tax=Craspedostauros australis TaxID=1486917 RepID=A0A7R9ZQN7_9STRA|mmetsp:Transcript_6073/g.16554  ORF Transcript_6073/g.16554 Transcript_6073/m.16554 type:complete len:120 (+) Transcript_6073:106-465(+)